MDPQEERIYTAIIITAIVLGVIITYFFISIIMQQRRNLHLHRQNIMAEINTLERERTRMAADLHDDLGPVLTSIKFRISSIEAIDKDDQFQLVKATNEINGLVNRLREIANDLMPSALTRKRLVPAVEEFISNMKGSSLKIIFTNKNIQESSDAININTFRIIQEVVNNTIKHAKASVLKIDLTANEKEIFLVCEDDGVGFNYTKAIADNPGHGLRNLKSRIDILAGKLFVDSKPGKGTRYYFKIPKTLDNAGTN